MTIWVVLSNSECILAAFSQEPDRSRLPRDCAVRVVELDGDLGCAMRTVWSMRPGSRKAEDIGMFFREQNHFHVRPVPRYPYEDQNSPCVVIQGVDRRMVEDYAKELMAAYEQTRCM